MSMSYLSNATVNRLNLHTAMHAFAWNMSGGFFVVYLFSHGFPAEELFSWIAAMFALRFVIRPIVLILAPRVGVRRLIALGGVFFALDYLQLARVNSVDENFVIYCLFYALADAFYWTCYHAIFAFVAEDGHRGRQIGAREALTTVVCIGAPLAGGVAIDCFGASASFAFAAAIEICAIVPLLGVPDLPVEAVRPRGAFSAVREAAFLFGADGWIAVGFTFMWSVVLFTSASSGFTTFGGLMTLGGLISAGGGLLVGKTIDRQSGAGAAALLNGGLLLTTIALKAVSAGAGSFGLNAGVMAVGSLLGASYVPVLMSAIYGLAARSPCLLRFTFVAEVSWDVGCVAACILTTFLLRAGMSWGWCVALAAVGALVQTVLLRKHHAGLITLPVEEDALRASSCANPVEEAVADSATASNRS
jgi:MFS transporter, DHA1 family, inner membrane transport protein